MLGDVPAMDTDFFAAGGDSLQAISLVAGLNQRYAIELPLGTVFEFPALRDLAAEVDRAVRQTATATR
jgi:acyl carrier protein